jgi:predicted dehydrogenase
MDSRKKIKCGVAGVGYLGQHHARIYQALPTSDLVGVYDLNEERAEKIAKKNKCPRFNSLEELGESCDAISVAVPTDEHCSVAIPLLELGCHLLIEKPLCSGIEEAERILSAAKKANTIVQVGHIEHFNPVMDFLEEAVNDPKYITADRLAPFNKRGTEVGVVLDLMIHDIGVILELVKSPVEKVESIGVSVLSSTEDIANARIQFKNGCVANINTSRVSRKKVREIRVFQPNAYLSLDFMNQKGHLLRKEAMKLKKEAIPIAKGEPLMLELASFVNCVASYSEPKVGASLGKSALEIAILITEQIQAMDTLGERR